MIGPEVEAEVRRLVLRDGWKIETVARRFGVHHSVVRRVIGVVPEPRTPKPPAASLLDPFKPYLVERVTDYPELLGTRLFLEIRDQGYTGSLATLRRFVAKVRAPRSKKAYLRVETEPGEQAQVDWGSFGKIRIGSTTRLLSCFAMVMSWSRALFVDFALDQRTDTFLRMHERAFAFFGGVPKKVLYDNLKTVVLHHVGNVVQFNPTFLAFAGHYLFEPVAAPPRYPEAKGRVENAIKYVRRSFFYGRSFRDLHEIRDAARAWCIETANPRLHATTRERPSDRLLVELPRLHPLPVHRYDTDLVVPTIVGKEARVALDTNAYSVPPELVGKTVHVRADDFTVRVVLHGTVAAEHSRCWERRRVVEKPEHLAALLERRAGARGPKRKDRIVALADPCRLYVQEVARRRIDLHRELEKLDRLLALYGPDDFIAGVTAALGARTFGARFVQTLIDQHRFARGLGEPPELVVTGNKTADECVVEPHDLGDYDDLF